MVNDFFYILWHLCELIQSMLNSGPLNLYNQEINELLVILLQANKVGQSVGHEKERENW